jgi:ABC-type transport system involved in Fe-S cluster assembly fused permease/ATPase subunit
VVGVFARTRTSGKIRSLQNAYANAENIAQQSTFSSIHEYNTFENEARNNKKYDAALDIAEKEGIKSQIFNGCGIQMSLQLVPIFCVFLLSGMVIYWCT